METHFVVLNVTVMYNHISSADLLVWLNMKSLSGAKFWKVSIIIFAEAIPFSIGRKFKVLVHLNSFVGHFTHICGAGVNTDTTALIGDKKVQIRCGWEDISPATA